jgi:chemotaxis protein CheD
MTGKTKTIAVIQGEYAVSADPDVTMSTVLGSCVAVCLFDPINRLGGMNHFLLASSSHEDSADLKYGVNAMELLINKLLRLGAERQNFKAKVFGGARMTEHARDIGSGNAAFARDFLEKEGIACISASLGGAQARRVQFIPTTGAARQLQISGPDPDVVPAPRPKPAKTEITLF